MTIQKDHLHQELSGKAQPHYTQRTFPWECEGLYRSPPNRNVSKTFRNTSNSSKTFSTLRSKKPSCLWGWVMQQNICYIDHHWDWEHLLQVKTTFLVALQGEIRNLVLEQAGKNKSAWLDSPTLQNFSYFWWGKKQTNLTQEPPAQDPGCTMEGVQVWDKQHPLSLEKCPKNTSEPLEQRCETHCEEFRTPRAKPGLSQSSWYRKPPASWGCLEGDLAAASWFCSLLSCWVWRPGKQATEKWT